MKLEDENLGMSEKEYQYYLECIEENKTKMDYGARLEKKKDIDDYCLKSYIHAEDRYKENTGGLRGLFNRDSSSKNPIAGWILIVMCVIMFFIWSDKAVRAIRELSMDSDIVIGTVTATDMKDELVRSSKSSRWVTYYYITYQWVGDNDMINESTRKTKDPAHPLVGEQISVTVRAENHNMEINSDDRNMGMLPLYIFMSIIWVAIGILGYMRHIKK